MLVKETEDVYVNWYFTELQRNYQGETYSHKKQKIESDLFSYLKKKSLEKENFFYKKYESYLNIKTDSGEILGNVIARVILEGKQSNSLSVREGCCDKEGLTLYLNFLLRECPFSVIVSGNKEEGKFIVNFYTQL